MISEMMIIPEKITSRYGTQPFCFRGSLIWNISPNKFKNLGKIEDFKKHIKKKNQEPAVENCVCNYIIILVSTIFQFGLVVICCCYLLLTILNYFVNQR